MNISNVSTFDGQGYALDALTKMVREGTRHISAQDMEAELYVFQAM